MSAGLLIDTDVLAAYLAGEVPAADFLEFAPEDLHVSAVTAAELLAAAAGPAEEDAITACLGVFTVQPADLAVARQAARLRAAHHGLPLGDALVAATATVRGLRLVSLDRRRYPADIPVHVPWRRIL